MDPSPAPTGARPLAGLHVFEVGRFIVLPAAGLALAQLGADVVRLDPLGGADDTRRAPRGTARRARGPATPCTARSATRSPPPTAAM